MTTRERNLSLITLGAVAVGVLWLILAKVLFLPAAEARRQAHDLDVKIADLNGKLALGGTDRSNWHKLTERSFGLDEPIASDNARAHLVKMIERAGLDPREAPLTPFTGKRIGAATQVGWVIRAKGSLAKATDLLFLLQRDPHLQRVDQISWMPIADSTDIELKARVTTLVLDALPGETATPIDPTKLAGGPDLKAEERRDYDLIAQRDVFKPYIKRPPPPPPTFTQRPPTRTNDERPAPPSPTPVKLVGLPTWDGKPQVVLKDMKSEKTRTLDVGDDLIGGKIAMVDYRELPDPHNPLLQSSSRMILRIGSDYWAVEIGQALTDKRKLAQKDLPEALQQPEPAATTPVSTPPATDMPDTPASNTPEKGTNPGESSTDAPASSPATAPAASGDSSSRSTSETPALPASARDELSKENRDAP